MKYHIIPPNPFQKRERMVRVVAVMAMIGEWRREED
jgi:hypothetical protein